MEYVASGRGVERVPLHQTGITMRNSGVPIVLPDRVRPGEQTKSEWANRVRECLQRLSGRGIDEPPGLPPNQNTVPPFWPTLATDDGGSTFTFTITDGFVVDHKGGNGNTAALAIHYPTGIGTLGGARTVVDIDDAFPQISIKVVVDKEGDITAVSLEVEPVDTPSSNPDPTSSGGTGYGGTFFYKIAVLRAAVGDVPAYLDYYLAGSHITFRHRGHNLDQHVYVVHDSGGGLSAVSDHYLCWRNGDYVGKFATGDTRPGYTGALDTSSVTYLTYVT